MNKEKSSLVARTARTTYYIAICVFLIFLAVLVVKMTFWPVCSSGSCDGWTVAGLVAAVLGVSTAFLGILGAIALAAWWTSLDKRVEDRVTQLFDTRIQVVTDNIGQLEKRIQEVQDSIDQLEKRAVVATVTEDQFNILRKLTSSEQFVVGPIPGPVNSPFVGELRHLLGLKFIDRAPGQHMSEFQNKLGNGKVDVKAYFVIKPAGRDYLELRTKVDSKTSAENEE